MAKTKSTSPRGFSKIVGKTIKSIDSTSINCVKIMFTDGTTYEIWAEERHFDIEVITCVKGKAE